MTPTLNRLLPCLLVVWLSACGASPQKTGDVWDTYDVRHPSPPAGYVDNDAYYVAPACSIMDAPSCGGD